MALDAGQVITEFKTRFSGEPVLYRAPGRINLIGEHTDYNDGFVMPLNTALYTWVAIRASGDRQLRVYSCRFDETVSLNLDHLEMPATGHWSAYVAAIALVLQQAGYSLEGADLVIDGDIPLGGGLSSSASLETALATALLGVSGHQAEPEQIARLCQQAENEQIGLQCGIMDPFVISACPQGHAMKLDCRSLEYETITLPPDTGILVIDSGVKHSLQGSEYNLRRQTCESAAAQLGKPSLRDVSEQELESGRPELSGIEYRRARHVISENERVQQAVTCINEGDLESLGRLLDASHASLRDDYEVSCKELDVLTVLAKGSPGVLGARMVGGGFGGCIIALVEADKMSAARHQITSGYAQWHGTKPWSHVVRSAPRAGQVEV